MAGLNTISRYKVLLIFSLLILSSIIFCAKVEAISVSNTFTNSYNGGHMDAMISNAGNGVLLNAPKAEFRVFRPYTNDGVTTVKVTGLCAKGQAIEYGRSGGTPQYESCSNTSTVIEINLGNSQFNQPGQYGGTLSSYETANVYVKWRYTTGGYYQRFQVSVPSGALITFDDMGVGTPSSPNSSLYKPPASKTTSGSGYPGINPFSVIPDSGEDNTFRIKFGPNCDYTKNHAGEPVYVKWYDADVGTGYGGSNPRFTITEYDANGNKTTRSAGAWNNGVISLSSAYLGGEGQYAYKSIGSLKAKHSYVWEWQGIGYRNGVQLWVPFSEMSQAGFLYNDSCKEVPDQDGQGACRIASATNDGSDTYKAPLTTGPSSGGTWDAETAGTTVKTRTTVFIEALDFNGNVVSTMVDDYVGSYYDNGSWHIRGPSKTWNYGPAVKVRVTITHKENLGWTTRAKDKDGNWYVTGTGRGWAPVAYDNSNGVKNCYTGTCSILNIEGDGPNGEVISGRPIQATVRITNDSGPDNQNLGATIGGHSLSITSSNATSNPNTNFESAYDPLILGKGRSATVEINIAANNPSSPGYGSVTAYPDVWYGLGRIGPDCAANYAVYAPFSVTNVSSYSELAPTQENPTQITSRTYACINSPVSTYVQHNDRATYNGGVYASGSGGNHQGCGNIWQDVRGPFPVKAGDRYCAFADVGWTSGYVGPGGPNDLVGLDGPVSVASPCTEVHNEPYVHVFNSDASAGGGWGDSCSYLASVAGGIKTYNRRLGANQYSGSGSQFAATARDKNSTNTGPINGFSGGIMRSTASDPLAPIGINIRNTGVNLTDTSSGAALGGNFDDPKHCVKDYFSGAAASGLSTTGYTGITSGAKLHNGPVTINGANLPDGQNSTVYVNGDVVITNNIVFTGKDTWNDLSKIGSLFIIAKGNIYIGAGVTKLDGVFIAQPLSDGTKGNIYTCANGMSATPPTTNGTWLNTCNKQLVVNGAFVAQHVALQRTLGSLRNSAFSERYGGAVKPCEEGSGQGDCAAEVFIFSPEIYLANPALAPTSGTTSGKYDYITSLSPVL